MIKTRPSFLKVYSGHQKGKDNWEGLEQPGGRQRKKNSRPYTWPGVKPGRRHKIVLAGERDWRPYASDGAMRTDDGFSTKKISVNDAIWYLESFSLLRKRDEMITPFPTAVQGKEDGSLFENVSCLPGCSF